MFSAGKQLSKCICQSVNTCRRHLYTLLSENVREQIHEAISCNGDIIFEPLRIRSATLQTSFSNAHVDITDDISVGKKRRNGTSENGELTVNACNTRFSTMFKKGFDILDIACNSSKRIPNGSEDMEVVQAVINLGNFVSELEKHQKSLSMTHPIFENEGSVVVVIANHLIGRLCGGDYIVSNDPSVSPEYFYCPCSPFCQEVIKYGRTGLGHPSLWYGYPDIIALPQNYQDGCNLIVDRKTDHYFYECDLNNQESQLIEIKKHSIRETTNVKQIIAQTITFSFCQSSSHQQIPDKFPVEVSLIPTVILSADEMDIYMYDYNHDILLRAVEPVAWSKGDQLDLSSIIYLWMILHHSWLHPRFMVSELIELEGSAGFHSLPDVQGKIEKFKKETTYRSIDSINKLLKEELTKRLLRQQPDTRRFAEKSEFEELKRRKTLNLGQI